MSDATKEIVADTTAYPPAQPTPIASPRGKPPPSDGGLPFVDLARAVAGWRGVLGDDCVIVGPACESYESNCLGVVRAIPVALRPKSENDVRSIVKVAEACRVPLYPISTGRNWGYGSAVPTADRCVVVDLSGMDQVVSFDEELGLVTVQPGVTQEGLYTYLESRGHDFMVPVTGAGPTCSLVGNALERGYGITPHADHFAAVRSIRAVLPDGQIYRSALAEIGGEIVDRAHKWGVGPYIDGLFSQGSLGIVTEMTIALAPLPECVEAFLIEIDDEQALKSVVDQVRQVLQSSGGGVHAFNLLNRYRLLSMFHPYPHDQVAAGGTIPPILAESLSNKAGLPRWLGLGASYGDREVVAGMRRAVRRRFAGLGKVKFVSRNQLRRAGGLLRYFPWARKTRLARDVAVGTEILDILSGRPRETALKLAYWKSKPGGKVSTPLNPSRDGCGVAWFSPLVPMKADAVRRYVDLVEEICPRFGFEPLLTLTSVSGQCFDSTVPLLFDPETDGERARACYMSLFESCKEAGFLPYRLSVQAMHLYTNEAQSSYWSMVRKLKTAIDPHNIIAPGRYAPGE